MNQTSLIESMNTYEPCTLLPLANLAHIHTNKTHLPSVAVATPVAAAPSPSSIPAAATPALEILTELTTRRRVDLLVAGETAALRILMGRAVTTIFERDRHVPFIPDRRNRFHHRLLLRRRLRGRLLFFGKRKCYLAFVDRRRVK